MLSAEAVQVLRDLSPWWLEPAKIRPAPPAYRRPLITDLSSRFLLAILSRSVFC